LKASTLFSFSFPAFRAFLFAFKNEQEGGQFLDSPSHSFFVIVLDGSAIENATVPSASAQSPVSYIASPSLPIFNHETHSYPSPTVHQTSFLLPCTFSPSLL
jgi:hypothetical protein